MCLLLRGIRTTRAHGVPPKKRVFQYRNVNYLHDPTAGRREFVTGETITERPNVKNIIVATYRTYAAVFTRPFSRR